MTLLQWLDKLIEEHKETNTCFTEDEFLKCLPVKELFEEHLTIAYKYYLDNLKWQLKSISINMEMIF